MEGASAACAIFVLSQHALLFEHSQQALNIVNARQKLNIVNAGHVLQILTLQVLWSEAIFIRFLY
jgi:hypothetical protein